MPITTDQAATPGLPASGRSFLRALTLHTVVPAGHVAVPVLTTAWWPHLQPGEFAVLDAADVEPQLGELYGLALTGARRPIVCLVQPYRSRLSGGGDAVMYRFAFPGRGTVYVDGPLSLNGWRMQCRGRVVGVLPVERGAHA